MTAYPVDSSHVEMGDPTGMDLDAVFNAIDAGRIADEASPDVPTTPSKLVDPAVALAAYRIVCGANLLIRSCQHKVGNALKLAGDHRYPIPNLQTTEQTAVWELIGVEFERLGYTSPEGTYQLARLEREGRDRSGDVLTIVAANIAVHLGVQR